MSGWGIGGWGCGPWGGIPRPSGTATYAMLLIALFVLAFIASWIAHVL